MKRKVLLFSISGAMLALTILSNTGGPAGAGNGNRTGSQGNATCGGAGCHGNPSQDVTAAVIITEVGGITPLTSYAPLKQYNISVGGQNTAGGHGKYGFQVTAVKSSATGTGAGTFATGGNASVVVRTTTPVLVEHATPINALSSATPNIYNTTFRWTAPAAGTGPVKFFAIINSVNGNGVQDNPDVSNATVLELTEGAPQSIASIPANVHIAAFPNPASGSLNVALAGAPSGTAELRMFDLRGLVVNSTTHTISGQNSAATIDISSLAAGMYQLDIAINEAHRVLPVVVK